MIEDALMGELSRQLGVWAAAFRNIDAINKSIAELDAQRAVLEEKAENEFSVKERAVAEIQGLLSEVEETPENRAQVEGLLKDGMGDILLTQVMA